MNKKIRKIIIGGFAINSMILTAGVFAATLNNKKSIEDKIETDSSKNVVGNIGSVSKTFVTVSVLQLVDQGKINLDESVKTYIPDFTMADDRYKNITVRMLLNHSSGLMGTSFNDSFLFEDNDSYSHDVFLEHLSRQRLKANPGEFSVYCNDGFWLAEILVERVSGESFTDYIKKNISEPLNLKQTGTPYDMFQTPEAIDIYLSSGDKMANEYVMDIGSGGIISSAPDLSRYGSSFFNGNNILISDSAKKEMFNSYAKDEFESPYGLGWDKVDYEPFVKAGVKVLEKGGSTSQQFTGLEVAPEEKVSVAVLTSGQNPIGSIAMARALMDIALKEKGIDIKDESKDFSTIETVPASFQNFEGFYTDGKRIFEISFPEMKSMRLTNCEENLDKPEYYKLTNEGGFVLMTGDGNSNIQDPSRTIFYFTKRNNGRTYIAKESAKEFEEFGINHEKEYFAEKIVENPVDRETLQAWNNYEGTYNLYSGKYSNILFSEGNKKLKVSKTIPGYIIYENQCIAKIVDKTHAKSFVQIPCNAGRDLTDFEIEQKDGKTIINCLDYGITAIKEDSFPSLAINVTEIRTEKNQAKWFMLTDLTKGKNISFNRSDKTSIYIFDKYGAMIYSTYMTEYPNEISLPTDGKIVFVGEDGEEIKIKLY